MSSKNYFDPLTNFIRQIGFDPSERDSIKVNFNQPI